MADIRRRCGGAETDAAATAGRSFIPSPTISTSGLGRPSPRSGSPYPPACTSLPIVDIEHRGDALYLFGAVTGDQVQGQPHGSKPADRCRGIRSRPFVKTEAHRCLAGAGQPHLRPAAVASVSPQKVRPPSRISPAGVGRLNPSPGCSTTPSDGTTRHLRPRPASAPADGGWTQPVSPRPATPPDRVRLPGPGVIRIKSAAGRFKTTAPARNSRARPRSASACHPRAASPALDLCWMPGSSAASPATRIPPSRSRPGTSFPDWAARPG
jgi:hypothetical protein